MAIVDELVAILGYEIRGEANLKRFDNGLRKAASNVERLSSRIVAYTALADKAFNASRSLAIPSAIAVVYANRVKDASLKTTGWAQAFEAVTGTAKGANKEIQFAADVADRYGANLVKVTDGWVKFKAATKGTKVADDNEEIFQTFTALSSILGQTPDQLNGILTALEQMVSKGKVSAEELRGQLGERLPGAFIAAAKAMNVTTAELDQLLQRGELTADKLLPKLARQLQQDYRLNLGDRLENDIATFNRLENALFLLKVSIARSGFVDFLSDLAEGMTALVRKISEAPPWVQKLIAGLIVLTAVSAPLLFIFGSLAKSIAVILKMVAAVRSLGIAFKVLGAVASGRKMVGFLSIFRKSRGVITAIRLLAGGFALLASPALLMAGAITAAGLAINDLWHFINGGESLIGTLAQQLSDGDLSSLGENIGTAIVEGIFFAFSKLQGAIDRFDALMNDPEFWKVGGEILENIVKGMLVAVFVMGASFAKIAGGIFWGIVNALLGFDAKAEITDWISRKIIEPIMNAWNNRADFYDLGARMISRMFEGMKSIGGKIKAWFADLLPDWAIDFIGSNQSGDQAANLTNNLARSGSNVGLTPGGINNTNTNSRSNVNNNINIEQNVTKAVDAPGQLAKAAGSALSGVMPKRSQLQIGPALP